jgi:hypothetical protein
MLWWMQQTMIRKAAKHAIVAAVALGASFRRLLIATRR